MRACWVLSLALLLPVIGCAAQPSSGAGASSPAAAGSGNKSSSLLEQQTRAGIDTALSETSVEQAFGAAFEQIGEDPAVARAGNELFERLSRDPELTEAANAIIGRLSSTREFQDLLERFRQKYPNDFDEQLARHTTAAFDSKEVDLALDKGSDELMQRPRVQNALDSFAAQLLKHGEIEGAFLGAFLAAIERADQGRLPKVIGVAPGDARYEEALGAYLTEPSRVERVLVGYARLFGQHPAPRQAIAKILRSEGMYRASVRPARALLRDEVFIARSTKAMLAVINSAGQSELDARAREVFASPAAERALVDWISSIQRVSDVPALFAGAFKAVAESPEFSALIEDVYFTERKTARIGGLTSS